MHRAIYLVAVVLLVASTSNAQNNTDNATTTTGVYTTTTTMTMSRSTAAPPATTTTAEPATTTTAEPATATTADPTTTTAAAAKAATTTTADPTTTPPAAKATTTTAEPTTTPAAKAITTTAEPTTTPTVDPCANVNCTGGGTCVVGNDNSASCNCTEHRSGTNCEMYDAYWGEWGAYGDCSATCGPESASKTRTKMCTDLKSTVRTDCQGEAEKETQLCDTLPKCVCTSNPCLDGSGQQTNAACNTVEGTTHTCNTLPGQDADGNPLCLLKCMCDTGYENADVKDGVAQGVCKDIDECQKNDTDCFDAGTLTLKSSVAACVNNQGGYSCTCRDGYKLVSGSKTMCEDIDECADDSLNNCDDSSRATCTNTVGSFSCSCKAGFSGEGTKCNLDRFVSGYNTNAETVTGATSNLVYIPNGGYLSSRGDKSVINSMYATRSGLVVFTSAKKGEPAPKNPFPNPGEDKLQTWSDEKLNDVNPKIVSVAAVYWAKNVISDGAIYSKMVEDLSANGVDSKLNETARMLLPDADWAYVVTWDKMKPVGDSAATELNSYQVIIVGDKSKATIKMRYIYQDRGMNWNLALFGDANQKVYPARVGVVFNGKRGDTYFEEYPASGLELSKYSTSDAWDSAVEAIAKIDEYNSTGTEVDVLLAGTNDIFITEHGAGYKAPSVACQEFLAVQESGAGANWEFKADYKTCPSNFNQMRAVKEANYEVISGVPAGYTCYKSRTEKQSANGAYGVAPRCCYAENGALLPEDSHGDVNGLSTVYRSDIGDEKYGSCCNPADLVSGLIPSAMCASFLNYFPACNAENYQELSVSQLRGDPHITTLDDLTYTFNGHGEFFLVKTENSTFVIQGRTGRVNATGQATVFTGFAAKLVDGTQVQFGFKEDFSAVELFIDGNFTDHTEWNSQTTFGDVIAYNDSGAYAIRFSNEVVMKISVSFEYKLMTVSLIMPPALSGKINGLMGNFNEDKADDFLYPNGSMALSSSATEEEIYPWGLTWMTTLDDSLFVYPTGKNWTDYNDASFTPVFFNSNLTIMFPDDAERTNAINLCNNGAGTDPTPEVRRECYFDFKVTGIEAVAAATADAADALASEKKELSNFSPVIHTTNATFRVTVGQSYGSLFTVNATDANGDNITYSITGPAGLAISAAGVISWTNVQFAENDSVVVTVSDGAANAILVPQVAICGCQNGGTCVDVDSSEAWYVQPCECTQGWTGDRCDEDIDGCADDPCFTICTDVAASKVAAQGSEFICDPCPAGLSGDGQSCYDVNECLAASKPCADLCENTAGSFVCSCSKGYALAANGLDCVDIDECLLGSDDCDDDATCTNTQGGFTCACKAGYSGDGKQDNCLNVDECATGVATCPANSACTDTEGSYICSCDYGYKKSGDNCVEIDECALGHDCAQICTDKIGYYSCSCKPDFVLDATDKVTCNPARNCSASEILQCDGGNNRSVCGKDSAGEILCNCPTGYSLDGNKNCQDINECNLDNLCSPTTSDCQNMEPGYKCVCKTGYQLSSDGLTCEDVDECKTNNGDCEQGCVNTAGSRSCTCGSGFTLNANGTSCDNVNECADDVNNNCDALNGACTDKVLSNSYPLGYECGCNTGYKLSADGFTCTDDNECNNAGRGGCTQGCSNSLGSYSCFCGNGYTLNATDGKSCDNINECASAATHNCYSTELCTDTDGFYECGCPSGFELMSNGFTCESIEKCRGNLNCSDSCAVINSTDICQCPKGYGLDTDQQTCVNVNECATPEAHICDGANNVKCVDLDGDKGAYRCDCVSDKYTQVEAAKCIDVDECAAGTANCSANSYCENKENGFNCKCNPGYAADASGNCVDVNECDGTNACDTVLGVCSNTVGAYECSCKSGYTGDGITCVDIKECDGENDCDPDPTRGICTEEVGSYSCSCTAGFVISATKQCDDIDECANKAMYNVSCAQVCTNTPGSFKCECQDGFRLDVDGTSCSPEVECSANNTCSQDCVKKSGVDTCTCKPGYSLQSDNKTCSDIDECAADNLNDCVNATLNGNCTNTAGSFMCSCTGGYTLGTNNVCNDRDGAWGAWGEYGNCTADCGDSGVQTRMRSCNNPTKMGNGMDCVGDANETMACNRILCPKDEASGVSLPVKGITKAQFDAIKTRFQDNTTMFIDGYCTANTAQAEACCGLAATVTLQSPVNKTFINTTGVNVLPLPITGGVSITVRVEFDPDTNEVCTAVVARRKRAVQGFSQDVLLTIMTENQNQFEQSINEALVAENINATVTVEAPARAEQVTTTGPTTTATAASASSSESATTAPGGVEAWVIAVAVVGALVAVAIVVIIVVVLIKRPGKVAASESNDERQDGNYQQNA